MLVVSFIALALGWAQPEARGHPGRVLFSFPRAVEVLCGVIGVFVFFVTAYAGIAGTDQQSENLTPTAVYVLFWVGVPFASLLFGDIWQFFSPWRAIGRAAGWIAARVEQRAARAARVSGAPRPAAGRRRALRLRDLRAVLGDRATLPGPLAIIALLYFVVMLIGHEHLRRGARGCATPTASACCGG